MNIGLPNECGLSDWQIFVSGKTCMSRKIIGRQFATNGNPCIIGFFKGDFVGAQVAYRSDGMINSGHFPIFFLDAWWTTGVCDESHEQNLCFVFCSNDVWILNLIVFFLFLVEFTISRHSDGIEWVCTGVMEHAFYTFPIFRQNCISSCFYAAHSTIHRRDRTKLNVIKMIGRQGPGPASDTNRGVKFCMDGTKYKQCEKTLDWKHFRLHAYKWSRV